MFGVFLFCYLDGHLSCCASCPFLKKGNLKRVLRRAFLFFFFFGRDGVSVFFFSCKRESLAFTFLFLSSVSLLRQRHSEGCTVFAAHAVRSVSAPVFAALHLSSVYIHSKLYMLVFFFFSNKDHELYFGLCYFMFDFKKKKKNNNNNNL